MLLVLSETCPKENNVETLLELPYKADSLVYNTVCVAEEQLKSNGQKSFLTFINDLHSSFRSVSLSFIHFLIKPLHHLHICPSDGTFFT